jgi:hypothetical protein
MPNPLVLVIVIKQKHFISDVTVAAARLSRAAARV